MKENLTFSVLSKALGPLGKNTDNLIKRLVHYVPIQVVTGTHKMRLCDPTCAVAMGQ